MNRFPSKEIVARLRLKYPAGTRVEFREMSDPYTKLKPSDLGTVDFIDDTGTIFVNWDSGSSLGVVLGADSVKKVNV